MSGKRAGAGQKRLLVDDTLFRVVAKSANDGIVSIDESSTILFANQATGRIFGYPQDELVGEPLTMLMPDYLRHLHEAAIERYIATGEKHLHWGGVELPGLHRDGKEIPLELSFGEAEEGGQRIFTGVIRDVSERKRSERRWEAQYEVAQILASGEDLEEATREILEKICNRLDWSVGIFWRATGNGALRASSNWHDPDVDVAAFLDASGGIEMTEGLGLPGRVARSGEPAWLPDVGVDDNYPRHSFAKAAGLHAAFAFPISTDGELVGVMEFYTSEVREPDATLLSLMKSTAVQIGEFVERRRAQVELQELNSDLERRVLERTAQLQSSNDELESFVYSVSHDLRAPLRGIDGFSQMLLEDFPAKLGETGRDHLMRIRAAAERMGNLIDDLLDLSRLSKTVLNRTTVDLSGIAGGVINDLRQRQPDRAVDVEIAPDMRAQADPKLMGIVLENLLGNSWKYTGSADHPFIEFGCREVRGSVTFLVRDNGAGFDMSYAEKLFRPFQRLHSPRDFEGTGVGLTLVQRIIQRHGGRVWAESEVGKGATFYFTLGEGNLD